MKTKILVCKEVSIEHESENIPFESAYNIVYSKNKRKFGWEKIWKNYINYFHSMGEYEVALEQDNRILRKLLKMKNKKLTFSFKEINVIVKIKIVKSYD